MKVPAPDLSIFLKDCSGRHWERVLPAWDPREHCQSKWTILSYHKKYVACGLKNIIFYGTVFCVLTLTEVTQEGMQHKTSSAPPTSLWNASPRTPVSPDLFSIPYSRGHLGAYGFPSSTVALFSCCSDLISHFCHIVVYLFYCLF